MEELIKRNNHRCKAESKILDEFLEYAGTISKFVLEGREASYKIILRNVEDKLRSKKIS